VALLWGETKDKEANNSKQTSESSIEAASIRGDASGKKNTIFFVIQSIQIDVRGLVYI